VNLLQNNLRGNGERDNNKGAEKAHTAYFSCGPLSSPLNGLFSPCLTAPGDALLNRNEMEEERKGICENNRVRHKQLKEIERDK